MGFGVWGLGFGVWGGEGGGRGHKSHHSLCRVVLLKKSGIEFSEIITSCANPIMYVSMVMKGK